MQNKILVTGGSGYIGNHIVKVLAATKPQIKVVAMSRRTVKDQEQRDEQTSRFKNVEFYQGDCLKPETFPSDLQDYKAVIHTVGTLLEGVDYKGVLSGGI